MFKAIAFTLTLLVSFAALGGEYSVYQRIHFQSASTWVGANKTCIHQGHIYHQKKQSILVSLCDDDNCKSMLRTLIQPVASTKGLCTEPTSDGCSHWEIIEFVQGPIVKRAIYDNAGDDIKGKTPKAVVDYQIPSCIDLDR